MDSNSDRLPIIIALVAVLGSGWFFMKAFKKKPSSREVVIEETTEETSSESTDEVRGASPGGSSAAAKAKDANTNLKPLLPGATPAAATSVDDEAERRMFAQVLDEMRDCLDMGRGGSGDAPVSVETLNTQLQGEFGNITSQGDRWYSWKLKTPGGEDRLLRLDYFEDEMGNPQREMHYFSMRSETDVFPIDLPPDKSLNPPDGYVEQLLGDGQVGYTEKAKYAIFPNGERVDFVEKNGRLAEIEVTKGERFFRCDSVKDRQSCHCVKEE